METRHANDFRPLLDRTPRFLDRVNTPWDDVPDLVEYNHRAYRRITRTVDNLARSHQETGTSNSQGILIS
jgi:hypothetical protein